MPSTNIPATIILKFKIIGVFICYIANGVAAGNKSVDNHFLNLSLEELLDVKVVNVTSVSKRSQKLTEVASAIFVITQDDIRRSGVTSIPEALRMAPGVQVARISTDKWAISVRGFNGFSSNKVQVLIDGRSDYSPLITGALWVQQDTLMEDIERIEIIRGPAGTVWGTNAVNGIINIITKNAANTQGTFVTAGGGSFEHGFFSARYGGKINEQAPFRIYAKTFTRDNTRSLSGTNNHDQWHSGRGGFRLDHTRGIDQLTLHGEIFYNSLGDTLSRSSLNLPLSIDNSRRGHQEGGYMRFRWDRVFSDKSSLSFQAAYDRNLYQLHPFSKYDAQSVDVDFQHRFPWLDNHDLTWGAHYRANINKVFDTEIVSFSPRQRTNHYFSFFVRDEITLIPKHLLFTVGTRLDHNDFTGLEVQPNARLMWTPNATNSIWLAVSRAVRIPSRSEIDAIVKTGLDLNDLGLSFLPFSIQTNLQGTKNFNSEKLLAYELGYRHQLSTRASFDIAGFINDYSQLRDFSVGTLSFQPPRLVVPVFPSNNASALTYGFEVSVDWKPLDRWRLQSSYSYLNMHISSSNLIQDPQTIGAKKANPQHQLSLRSNYDISEKLQLNLWLRYTSNIAFYNIPSYVTMDTKLAWKPTRHTEIFLVGQNLLSKNHREYVSDIVPSVAAHIPRGIFVGAQWRF